MDCIAVINKAAGMTSHDVVAHVRKIAGQRRVGHAGTLDPAATGVLPVLLGQATRVAEYLSESGKAYRALIRFGVETNTYDADGEVLYQAPVNLERAEIERALPAFLGAQQQIPPIYSAIKRGGVPLYTLARAGETVEVEPRQVVINALTIVDWNPPDLTLDVDCGKGTYIRSLAHDLGALLGPGAHLAGLIRTRSGPFTLDQSITLEELDSMVRADTWRDRLYAADEALLDWRAAILNDQTALRFRDGQRLRFDASAASQARDSELVRVYSTDGRFLGLMRWSDADQTWQPHKSLAITYEPD